MKKIVFLFVMLSSLSYGFDFKIKSELPVDVEKSIRSATSSGSSTERRENFRWYKDSYLEMEKRLDAANIPEPDRNYIEKKLKAMYGSNYPKQLSMIDDEIAEYQNLVNRIREEQRKTIENKKAEEVKNKVEIQEILDNSYVPENIKEKIKTAAEREFPENYLLQKAYIKGGMNTWLMLK